MTQRPREQRKERVQETAAWEDVLPAAEDHRTVCLVQQLAPQRIAVLSALISVTLRLYILKLCD